MPFLVDATRLHAADQGASNWGMDLGGRQRDGFASIVAVGPRAAPVRRANTPTCYRVPKWPDPEFPRKIPKKKKNGPKCGTPTKNPPKRPKKKKNK